MRGRNCSSWLGAAALLSGLTLGCTQSAPPAEAAPSGTSQAPAPSPAPAAAEPSSGPPVSPAPESTDGTPEMDENGETRTTKVVADIVKSHRDEVRGCYDAAEEKYPGIQGDVMIRFVIAPDGHVQSLTFAREESTLTFQELADCMMAKMKQWKFPPSSLGMESRIGYPFNFNPKRR